MLILIDDADLKAIERLLNYLPIDGVTTNPSILAKQARDPLDTLRKIRDLLPETAQLHAQVVATSTVGMVADALHLRAELGEQLFVKVPVTPPGYAAMKELHTAGVPLTATGIYTPMQAFLAAKAGARYAAPYVNRLDNMGADGVRVAGEIHTLFRTHGLEADVLAASFKNSQQILDLCRIGVGAVTAAPDVISNLVLHPATTEAIAAQNADIHHLIGPDRTMSDL